MEGFCIRCKDGKLSIKATTESGCLKRQAFIPAIAGAQGKTGLQGNGGANGSARAYGFVNSKGDPKTALSSSNVAARKVASGGVSASIIMPVVSADQDDGSGSFYLAQVKSLYANTFGCTTSEWGIHTTLLSSGSVATSNVAFSSIIPRRF